MHKAKKIHIITSVWGARYSDLFLNICLPTVFTPDNLPFFSKEFDSVFHLHTTRKDFDRIRSSVSYRMLEDILPIEVSFWDDILIENLSEAPYNKLLVTHKKAIKDACKYDAGMVFIHADYLFPNSFFMRLSKIINQKKKLVFVPDLRVDPKIYLDGHLNRHYGTAKNTINVTNDQFIKMLFEYMHDFERALFWDKGVRSKGPCHIYLRVNERAMLGRCYQMTPMFINAGKNCSTDFLASIDEGFVNTLNLKHEEIYICKDAQELILGSITHYDQKPLMNLFQNVDRQPIFRVAELVNSGASELNRYVLKYNIRFYYGANKINWRKAEIKAAWIYFRISFLLMFYKLYGIARSTAKKNKRLVKLIKSIKSKSGKKTGTEGSAVKAG